MTILKDSPVDVRRRELPQGDGNWPGSMKVWENLQKAAHHLAQGKHTHLSYDHVETMAIMGCGHEETMKHWQMVCRNNGWLK